MDPEIEFMYLQALEERKSILLAKDSTKEMKKKKKDAWDSLMQHVNESTTSCFTNETIVKKWSNILDRIKKRKQYQKGTGGGRYALWPRNDLYVVEVILEADDPAINQVPGGVGALSKHFSGKDTTNDEVVIITPTSPTTTRPKNKRKRVPELDVSPQMRVVRLQEKALVDEEEIRALKKQKLEIQIKKKKMKLNYVVLSSGI